MQYPNFNEEKKLWKKRYKFVVGLDEAGRGCLAGPVVAAAVLVKESRIKKKELRKLNGVRDSKKLSGKQREEFFKILAKCDFIEWGMGRVSEKIIDKINILEATKLAMKKAVKNLQKKLEKPVVQNSRDRENFGLLEFLIVDGNFTIDGLKTLRQALLGGERGRTIPQKAIIKGDEKVFSVAAASIIAKVTRDKIMKKYHRKYPQYRFDKHKGYPTKLHKKLLKKYGASPIHRKSFRPVRFLF